MAGFKLGRTAPLWTPAHMRASYHTADIMAALGPPPAASFDYVSAVTDLVGPDWGMFLNDQLGDCTAADCGHTFMIRRANVGQWLMPKDSDILAIYKARGYVPGNASTDQGADEGQVCAYMRDVGMLGDKSVGTAPVATGLIDDAAIDRIKWSIQLFGACRLGVNLPDNAEAQFDAGEPWAISANATIEGGHDVPAVRYNPQYFEVVTWGGLQQVEWDWLKKYGEEAHAELWADFLMSGSGVSPAGFDMAALTTRLAAIAA